MCNSNVKFQGVWTPLSTHFTGIESKNWHKKRIGRHYTYNIVLYFSINQCKSYLENFK